LGPGARLLEPREGVAGVDREPDGAAGVGDAACDGLSDPPRGVRRELEALAPVELLDRVHQAEVALLDQVEERQARRLVLLGDRDHQPQVRLHERGLGQLALVGEPPELTALALGQTRLAAYVGPRLVARLDGLGQAYLIVFGEQWVLPYVREVETDVVFLIPLLS